MESAQAQVRYVTYTKVTEVTFRQRQSYKDGVGAAATFEEIPLGWFVYMEGSYEALHVGMDKPDLEPGDKIKITVEKNNG
jgi:hypothetical protein